jgi:DDE superfamily endonuclease
VIAPEKNAEFVAAMEKVLEVYKHPYNQKHPVICMDESSKQLIEEVVTPIPASPNNLEKQDYEYKRNGVCNIFMVNEPLTGKRYVEITEKKTKKEWGKLVESISNNFLEAEKITLLMDNYATHTAGALGVEQHPMKYLNQLKQEHC